MIQPYAVLAFVTAVLPLVATPGTSLALLMRHTTEVGRRRALPVILGTVTGLYAHATLATAGLSALVMHSSQAFNAVKLAGAAYLIALGVWTWRTATRPPPPHRRPCPPHLNSLYAQALLGNVLNPKAASIYLTLAPQFLTPTHPLAAQLFTLATAHALLMTLWLLTWTLLIRRATLLLHTPRAKATAARLTALAFLALGIHAATA
ncbi:LysE family translocator [Streptomyces sp. NBC_00503]|uniref:LysE family translocator n=1 Tax=Streptomyces sp. NBC_00503 TaxID=2903659 RepID=UPI002E8158EC|nr:LysE family translocator [Streptomyces sp. NBC_00503]WUD79226.1 LysE family translocator [Streptomyces sp. NBC_00503]